jgi:hypothetical protein
MRYLETHVYYGRWPWSFIQAKAGRLAVENNLLCKAETQ